MEPVEGPAFVWMAPERDGSHRCFDEQRGVEPTTGNATTQGGFLPGPLSLAWSTEWKRPSSYAIRHTSMSPVSRVCLVCLVSLMTERDVTKEGAVRADSERDVRKSQDEAWATRYLPDLCELDSGGTR